MTLVCEGDLKGVANCFSYFLFRVSRSSPSTRETSFSGKRPTVVLVGFFDFVLFFRNGQDLRQLHTSPTSGALKHPDENLQEPPEPPESPERAEEEELFPTTLAGGCRGCGAEGRQGITFEQPPGTKLNLIFQTIT